MGQWLEKWVAWRTLRARVERDGSIDGRPMYRVNNLQVVLARDGKSFNRVTTCSSCGRARATRRTVTPVDLHSGRSFELCADCVPTTTRPMDLGDVRELLSDQDDERPSPPPGIE